MIKNYLKIAWRNVIKHKGYAAINIIGLSVGVCSCIVIYLITSFEFSYDRFHPDNNRIYHLVASERDQQGHLDYIGGMMNPLPATMRTELTGFETVATFHNYYAGVVVPNGSNEPKRFSEAKRGEQTSPIIITGPQYFNIFQYQWLQGNPGTALTEPFSVVLSEHEARRYFGNQPLENIIGKVIFYKDVYLNDSLRVSVTGIVKDWEKNTDLGFKDFISLASVNHSFLKDEIRLDHWGNWNPNGQAFVKLAKGVTAAQIEKQFPAFVTRHVPPYPGHQDILSLQPLADLHFNSLYRDLYSRKASLPVLYGLMAIAVIILIIAAINFINLATAQSLNRAKEVGVRKVLGSSRASLFVQFFTETLIITFAAVVVSALMVFPIIALFGHIIPAGVSFSLFKPSVLIFLFLITIITALLAGFYPAHVLASYSPVSSLKGQASSGSGQTGFLRKSLIVFQFTVSMIFIVCTVIIGRQMHFILNKDLGFNKDAIITYHTRFNSPANQLEVFMQKIKQIPGVQQVSVHTETPGAKDHSHTHIDLADLQVPASYELGDANYISLFGLKLVAGRNIMPSDTIAEFLINEKAAQAMGFNNPAKAIGKMVATGINDKKGRIVGVLKDFNATSLHEAIIPFFFTSDRQSEHAVSIQISGTGAINNFTTAIEKINSDWKNVYNGEPADYSFFDDTIAALYATEQKTSQLINTAMTVAVLISCLGLLGLAAFTAKQRVKEIGIRKVLGATAANIALLLTKDFLRPVILSILVASPLAYYFMYRWLEGFAYRINISIWMFVSAGFGAIVIAIITVSFQSVKAAIANPAQSLKEK
ncbi:ABC transporter permease [Mucilaginibacter sp. dw_454]|uniref:ABC transporter permease n=1 Tax=Mucilaginibacter sp. dw_454 TaxID=2720079 RepID=UPI001BD4D809|nr:ABC transporter permease [Mucilaginibacter sp. dw_454]